MTKKEPQPQNQKKKKRPYTPPTLVVEGSIEQMTQASGTAGTGDALFPLQGKN